MSISYNDLIKIRAHLRSQIIKDRKFIGHENERNQILGLLKRTLENGESNSIILIGPRSIGKTTLMNDILNQLQKYQSFSWNAVLVRLHGLLHTDDRLALKSIASQMNLENAVNGKVFSSFSENLSFLLACLRVGEKETAKSVFFVLEEFDLFCAHHNQTLLYNLFDVSQSKQTPICVFGITCRLDIIELFEKRVKSRFSHRQIFFFDEQNENSNTSNINRRVNRIRNLLSCKNIKRISTSSITKWNNNVEKLLEDQKFLNLMQHLLDNNSNEHVLKNIIFLAVSKLNEKKSKLTTSDFEEELLTFQGDDMVNIIQDISILEICLLIAIKHHTEIYDNQHFNFEMIHTRYIKFVNKNSSIQGVQRGAILKAFEHLQKMELIGLIVNTGGRLQKEYRLFKLLVTFQQITEALKNYSNLPTEVGQWASSSLM